MPESVEIVELESQSSIIPYSQNDPRWAGGVYGDGVLTFAQAGCYVTCVAMLNTLTGSTDTPDQVAVKMREVKCFSGEMLSIPQNIPHAYPLLEWPAGAYWNRDGALVSHSEMDVIKVKILTDGPLILKVDYKPENAVFNMHFVLAIGLMDDDDLVILDPIDGQESTLLERYGRTRGWTIGQAIFGYRGLRVK